MIPEDAVDAWVASAAPDTIVGRLRDERKNMTNQVIPEAAVEAAAQCLPGYDPNWGGDDMDRAENEALRSRARQMLEAAAPHMLAVCDGGYTCPSAAHIEGCFRPHVENELLAKAWDEGEADGQDNSASNRGFDIEHKTNPYRPTP